MLTLGCPRSPAWPVCKRGTDTADTKMNRGLGQVLGMGGALGRHQPTFQMRVKCVFQGQGSRGEGPCCTGPAHKGPPLPPGWGPSGGPEQPQGWRRVAAHAPQPQGTRAGPGAEGTLTPLQPPMAEPGAFI